MTDMVNHPAHYESHPVINGECWDYAKYLCNGAEFSAFRYAWRYADKFNPLEDLNKAGWYLDRLIAGDVITKYAGLHYIVKDARGDVAGVLENDLAAYTGGTSGELARRGSVNVLIAIMRGEYALAKSWLDYTTACYETHVAGTDPSTHLDVVDPAVILEDEDDEEEEDVNADGESRHVVTSFTYAAKASTMSYMVDGAETGRYTHNVTVYAETVSGELDMYISLHDYLAGCESLVTALVAEEASLFTYESYKGQVKWSLKVAEVSDKTKTEIRALGNAVDLFDVTRLKVVVTGLEEDKS